MDAVLYIMVILLAGLRGAQSQEQTVRGALDDTVSVTCSHMIAYHNHKYFCKDPCEDQDILVKSQGKGEFSNGRYSILDEGHTFHVTITKLEKNDSGLYRCGVDRIGPDTYITVQLVVEDGNMLEDRTTNASYEKLVYVCVGLGTVLLLLALVLLVFFRQRSKGGPGSFYGKNHVALDEFGANQQPDEHTAIPTASSADEEQQNGSRHNPIVESSAFDHQDLSSDPTNVYSNILVPSELLSQSDFDVSHRPGKEKDRLQYAVVIRSKNPNSTGPPHSDSVTYSTVRYNH